MYKKLCFPVISILLMATLALAEIPGDGERIANTCAGCHGTRGASPGSHIPVIGGQNAAYLTKVMKEYRDGARPGGVMANLAKGYTDSQIEQTSKAVAAWKWKNTPFASKSTDAKKAVSLESCKACHGKKGEGTAFAPHINGQSPEYMKEALIEYKDSKRKAPEMDMVKNMTATDIDSFVTHYTRSK